MAGSDTDNISVKRSDKSLSEVFIKIIITLLTAAVLTGAAGIWDLTTSVAVLQEQIRNLQSSMEARTSDRYTSTDASRDKMLVEQKFQNLEKQVIRLEEELEKYKNKFDART